MSPPPTLTSQWPVFLNLFYYRFYSLGCNSFSVIPNAAEICSILVPFVSAFLRLTRNNVHRVFCFRPLTLLPHVFLALHPVVPTKLPRIMAAHREALTQTRFSTCATCTTTGAEKLSSCSYAFFPEALAVFFFAIVSIHTYTDGGEEERRGNRKDRFYLFISFSISFSVSFSFSFSLSLMSRLMSPFGRSFVCLPSPIPVAIFTYYTLNLFCSVLSCECVCYGRVLSHRNRTTNYR